MENYFKVNVIKILYDETKDEGVLNLKCVNEKSLIMRIGLNEATVIQNHLSGKNFKRPLTADLCENIIRMFDSRVDKLIINDKAEGVYYSLLRILSNKSKDLFDIDCRPSDGVGLALKFSASIYINEKLLEGK